MEKSEELFYILFTAFLAVIGVAAFYPGEIVSFVCQFF